MVKVNTVLLPIKAHYFFFMAAMGPILPQLPVYGKQLGISPVVMGTVTGILPILFLLSKPLFGFIVDRFQTYRKVIFILLVLSMGFFYALIYFIPERLTGSHVVPYVDLKRCNNYVPEDPTEELHCNGTCSEQTNFTILVNARPSKIHPHGLCLVEKPIHVNECSIHCRTKLFDHSDVHPLHFWTFVILMSAGTIGFNVVNSISDAICFDLLGEGGQMSYGNQRVWGTIGFGTSALLSGFVVNWWTVDEVKSFTPALVIMLLFLSMDVVCCMKLELPVMNTPKNLLRDVFELVKLVHVRIFMVFAALAGIVDSFIIYFFFWFLEDVADSTGHLNNIKLIEGIIVAAETLCGEVVFFSISGLVLKRIGYGHSLSLCFINYALRLGLISVIANPWWAIPIEMCFQGPTYAMSYTTIVAYASAISPPGTSATMQGIVAGIDDGFGYAVGSFFGGILYRIVGGRLALQIFSMTALFCGIIHVMLYKTILQSKIPETEPTIQYRSPEDAIATTEKDT